MTCVFCETNNRGGVLMLLKEVGKKWKEFVCPKCGTLHTILKTDENNNRDIGELFTQESS
jgi:predicted RNA-binding Zn-ribbon protein involved in translation (DUF1610 family)